MGSDTHSTLVSIPNCTAVHVLGSASIPLTSGTLSLTKSSSAAQAAPYVIPSDPQAAHTIVSTSDQPASAAGSTPVLALQIGKLAFPLMTDTLFGTDATSSRVYLFVPELGPLGEASEGSGYIRLELPPQAEMTGPGGERSLQDAFEQTLVGEGLLKEGWEAVRDEIERGVKSTVEGLKGKVSSHLATESGRVPPEAIEAD
jgi:hypothetical protein